MKKYILLAVFSFSCFSMNAQETTKTAQVHAHYSALAPVEWGSDHGYMGGGLGISAAMSKRWVISADFTFYGRDIEVADGYVDRNIIDTRGSVDFYFSRAFRGFFVGGLVGYTQINSESVNTTATVQAPDQIILAGIQLGFSTALTENIDLNLKTAFGSGPGQAGMYTFNAGIGYRF